MKIKQLLNQFPLQPHVSKQKLQSVLKYVKGDQKRYSNQEEDSPEIPSSFDFYVDFYSDENKIKEIISIFRNDFKPPKNLWIEQLAPQSNIDYYAKIFSEEETYVYTTDDEVDVKGEIEIPVQTIPTNIQIEAKFDEKQKEMEEIENTKKKVE